MVELAQRFGEPESVPGTSVNWVFQLFDRPSKIRGPEKITYFGGGSNNANIW